MSILQVTWVTSSNMMGGTENREPREKKKHSFDQKYAVENRHYVTDLHATVQHQLGLDPRELTIAGHKRLEKEYGEPIRDVIA